MVFCIITAKQQNWQRFSGPPPDTDTKSTLRDSKLIEKRIDFDTRVAFAEGEADMSRYLLFEEVEGHGEGYMWPNVRTALAGTWVNTKGSNEIELRLTCHLVNVNKYFGRACVPGMYYPRRDERVMRLEFGRRPDTLLATFVVLGRPASYSHTPTHVVRTFFKT
ncbi:hypothetical protein C8R48DRAFT_679533 [Suillus tomentosus]|nr:hypothetical protein C8R48DRAFT_679533 [Suillus tomentosus]